MKDDILFYGGTFDPIHIGHIFLAQKCLEEMKDISKVVFIPSGNPAQKENRTDCRHRYKMCESVVDNIPRFDIENYECTQKGLSYAIKTVDFLIKKYGINRPKLLIARDVFRTLYTWHKIDELVEKCSFIVGLYPDPIEDSIWPDWIDKYPYNTFKCYSKMKLDFLYIPQIDIRSTEIRERIKKGMSIKYMVPEPVEEYIRDNNLYKS